MTNWATLIAFELYVKLINLPGCRNDLKLLSRLLQERYGFQEKHAEEKTYADIGKEAPKTIPTYNNIINALINVVENGKLGDLLNMCFGLVSSAVHIYILPRYSSSSTYGDMVLLPANVRGASVKNERILYDVELLFMLSQACKKGLQVTAFPCDNITTC